MTDFEKDEFWKALTRLYDSTEKTAANVAALERLLDQVAEVVNETSQTMRQIVKMTGLLVQAVEQHDERLGRLEKR